MRELRQLTVLSLAISAVAFAGPAGAACLDMGAQVQILGSGGPGASSGRASSAYILWIDGVGRIVVDAGGGTKDQFHAASASLEDIELVALSHLHPDHSAEFPAILWPAGGELSVAGPTAGGVFPSISGFLEGLFGDDGVFAILGGRTSFEVITVNAASGEASEVWRAGEIRVRGIGVPHGNVPAIGYRIDVGDASIAFSSDQNGSDPAFAEFARGVDVLVIHMAATEDANAGARALHARPSVWGRMAADAEAGRVLVSHIATSSPQVLQESLGYLREHYDGPVTVGEDLLCVDVGA